MNKITATLIFITALFESIATDSIQIWPRNPSVIWPSNLEQFMYIELGQLELAEKWTLKLELPQETQTKGWSVAFRRQFLDSKTRWCHPISSRMTHLPHYFLKNR